MVSDLLKVLPFFVDVVAAAGLVPSWGSRKAIALGSAVPRNIVKRGPHSVMQITPKRSPGWVPLLVNRLVHAGESVNFRMFSS